MTRLPSLLATSTAALVVAGLFSTSARAADPTAPVQGAPISAACTGIPWIAPLPDDCKTPAEADTAQPEKMEIRNLAAGGVPVFVDANGQLGTVTSSARYKMDIDSMHFDPAKLLELRPVTFHYKADPNGPAQYGLIAEEVEKLFPDLVVRGADGKVQSVRYDELSSILLSEVQAQQTAMSEQMKAMSEQQKQLDSEAETMKMQYHQLQAEDEQLRYLGDRVAQMQKLVEKLTKSSQ